jgi:carboxymethylenebutenolidase
MSQTVHITAGDGHHFTAYEAGSPEEGIALVLIQEIFGVNHHIRSVADAFAKEGFYVVAPALFDRIQEGVDLDATAPEHVALARGYATRLEEAKAILDLAATVGYVRAKTGHAKVGVVGFCLGGVYAWLSATRLQVDAAVGYYGSKISQYVEERPRCPVILHFGNRDRAIPESDVTRIVQAQPDVPVFMYDAGHAFNRAGGPNYSAEAATVAWSRSVKFLKETLTK